MFADTWSWDGKSWNEIEAGERNGRTHLSMTYDANCEAVVRFGGKDLQWVPYGNLWQFKGNQRTLKTPEGPPARIDHALAFDQNRGKVLLFGRKISEPDGRVFGDT